MSLLQDWMEDFELIMPNGDVYGKIKGFEQIQSGMRDKQDVFATYSEKVNLYDIVRRCKDGKCFRILWKDNTDNPCNFFEVSEYTLFTT